MCVVFFELLKMSEARFSGWAVVLSSVSFKLSWDLISANLFCFELFCEFCAASGFLLIELLCFLWSYWALAEFTLSSLFVFTCSDFILVFRSESERLGFLQHDLFNIFARLKHVTCFSFTYVSVLGNGSITALFFVMGGPPTPVLNSSLIFFHRTVGCPHYSVHLLSSLCGTGREVVLRFIQQGVLLVLVCEPRPSGKDGWNASTAYRDRRMGDGGRRAALERWRWSVEP